MNEDFNVLRVILAHLPFSIDMLKITQVSCSVHKSIFSESVHPIMFCSIFVLFLEP